LSSTLRPHVTRHQPRQYHRDGLRHAGEKSEAAHREPEQFQRDPAEERRNWRVGRKAPRQMPRIFQRCQLVTMPPVAIAEQEMNYDSRKRDINQ